MRRVRRSFPSRGRLCVAETSVGFCVAAERNICASALQVGGGDNEGGHEGGEEPRRPVAKRGAFNTQLLITHKC